MGVAILNDLESDRVASVCYRGVVFLCYCQFSNFGKVSSGGYVTLALKISEIMVWLIN